MSRENQRREFEFKKVVPEMGKATKKTTTGTSNPAPERESIDKKNMLDGRPHILLR
jgi:hypothetical protein